VITGRQSTGFRVERRNQAAPIISETNMIVNSVAVIVNCEVSILSGRDHGSAKILTAAALDGVGL
jgi:hypothetical protein